MDKAEWLRYGGTGLESGVFIGRLSMADILVGVSGVLLVETGGCSAECEAKLTDSTDAVVILPERLTLLQSRLCKLDRKTHQSYPHPWNRRSSWSKPCDHTVFLQADSLHFYTEGTQDPLAQCGV